MADQQQIIDAIKNRFAGVDRYNLATAKVVEDKPFLLGTLYCVDFKRRDNSEKTVYAWAPQIDAKTGKSKGSIQVFRDTDELIPFVSMNPLKSESPIDLFLSRLTLGELVSGSIAMLLTISIIILIIMQIRNQSSVEVPQVLSGALTTILGFYFGKYQR